MDRRTDLHLDIIHAILQQFQLPDDAKTLGICSRVCRSWLPIARNHLFSDMHLRLVQNVDGVVPQVEPNEKWVEWNGFFKPKYADVSLVKELSITSFNAVPILTPPILSSTLASFPRLQRLLIYFARMPIPQSAAEIPILRSSLDKLELWNVSIALEDFCNLMSLFPHTRSIFLTNSGPDHLSPPPPIVSMQPPCTLQPSELSVTGGEDNHPQWLDFFGRSRAVTSIRKFRFEILGELGEHGQPLDIVHFIAKLKNLESLVWVDRTSLPMGGWPFGDTFHTRLTSRVRLFQEHIAPIFAETQTLRSFSLRPSPSSVEYLQILQSLPQSLRHFEIHLTQFILGFNLETVRLAMARLSNLVSVRIVVMDWVAEYSAVVPFEDYVDGVHARLPELDARGILEVVWEKNGSSYGNSDDDLVLMPQEPPSL